MNPFLLLTLAFVLPLVMMILLAGPIYAGGYAGLILLYGMEVSAAAMQVDYQLSVYQGLLRYWQTHPGEVTVLDFILPAFGPLAIGLLSGVAFFTLFVRYLRRVFTA